MSFFKSIDLTSSFNSGIRGRMKVVWDESATERWRDMPSGKIESSGIPFHLGSAAARGNRFLAIGKGLETIDLPVKGKGRFLCVLHFCDAVPQKKNGPAPGDTLAEYTVRFVDGSEVTTPVRAGFQIGPFGEGRSRANFVSVRYVEMVPVDAGDTIPYGRFEAGVKSSQASRFQADVFALELPSPAKQMRGVTLAWRGGLSVGVLGLTLYNGPGHPLRLERRNVFSVTLPPAERGDAGEFTAEVDLGHVTGTSAAPTKPGQSWTGEASRGLGLKKSDKSTADFHVEAATALGATLSVRNGANKPHSFVLDHVYETGSGKSLDGASRIRMLHGARTWVHARVIDDSTGKATPTRITFAGPNGEYLPPHGHHSEVNTNWFEDYAGEVKLGDTNYAYVPGEFQIELPEGDVYVEYSKGFEYQPTRKKVTMKRGQRKLDLHLKRPIDLRADRWVTADTHVHFISPQTAWLEGQAEGLNLVNLLASQWGRMFTNVGDITGQAAGASADDTIVWVGTENRHHMLGHISMLGTQGEPVFPMCFGGPNEGYFGDPEYNLLAEWAEMCRARGGAVIRPHFPGPIGEDPTYLINQLADAVEIRNSGHPGKGPCSSASLVEWYRYLNCGYRVTAAGGTDKMSAATPVGGSRTYARLGKSDGFSFASWTKAVRAGRTFVSNGPMINLSLNGAEIGDQVAMRKGGGTLEAIAAVHSVWPVHVLDLIVNGRVVDSVASKQGQKTLVLRSKVKIDGTSWVAARTASRYEKQQAMMGAGYLGAHTSPIYVKVDGSDLFSPSDAVYMLTLLEGTLAYLDTLGTRLSDARHAQMMSIVSAAQHELQHRMDHHSGSGHHHGPGGHNHGTGDHQPTL